MIHIVKMRRVIRESQYNVTVDLNSSITNISSITLFKHWQQHIDW